MAPDMFECARTGGEMAIELDREVRAQLIASLEKFFEVEREERLGNIAAGSLLGFILEEIGPTIYNKGAADAQERMQQRVIELDIEVHEDEFEYWRRRGITTRGRRR